MYFLFDQISNICNLIHKIVQLKQSKYFMQTKRKNKLIKLSVKLVGLLMRNVR